MLLTENKKILTQDELLATLKEQNKTVATLNGSFDLLHAGHLYMIREAAKQAELLVMLLNTDASIKRYKGKDRPLISLKDRQELIAALGMVDYVSSFDEDDPREILGKIKPDVHVNGSEYGENCIEAEVVKKNGGTLHIVSLVPGLSTSNIVKKIEENYARSRISQ